MHLDVFLTDPVLRVAAVEMSFCFNFKNKHLEPNCCFDFQFDRIDSFNETADEATRNWISNAMRLRNCFFPSKNSEIYWEFKSSVTLRCQILFVLIFMNVCILSYKLNFIVYVLNVKLDSHFFINLQKVILIILCFNINTDF